jgi:hypothetical protein
MGQAPMTVTRKFLLPPNLSKAERHSEVEKLVRKYARRGIVTTGGVEDRYPGEQDWIAQPGNNDERRRVHYAFVLTRRMCADDL